MTAIYSLLSLLSPVFRPQAIRTWARAAAAVLLAPIAAPCQEPIPCGTLRETTLLLAESPYVLNCDVELDSITIEPGVVIQAAGNYSIVVLGNLRAVGSEDRPIQFTTTPDNDSWQGILFDGSAGQSKLEHCIVEKSTNSGLRIRDASPQIRNCEITRNRARNGSGIHISGSRSVTLESCAIHSNTFTGNSPRGGGIYATSPVTLINCDVRNNAVVDSRGDCFRDGNATTFGGGIYSTTLLTMQGSAITGNRASSSGGGENSRGGGIYSTGPIVAMNCAITNNEAGAGGCNIGDRARGFGGGVFCSSTVDMTNCIVGNNRTRDDSHSGMVGGIYVAGGIMVNCTVACNTPGGLFADGSVDLLNCIVHGNSGSRPEIAGAVCASFSNIAGGASGGCHGPGNFDADPLLVCQSEDPDDLRIPCDSPCVDAGNPATSHDDFSRPPTCEICGTARNDVGAHGGPFGCGSNIGSGRIGISSSRPNIGGNSGEVTVVFFGFGFTDDVSARLVIDKQIVATPKSSHTASPLTMQTTFDLRDTDPGTYTLEILNAAGQNAVAPQPFVVQQGGEPDVRLTKGGTTAVPGRTVTYFVVARNEGSIDSKPFRIIDYLDPWMKLASGEPQPITSEGFDTFPAVEIGHDYQAILSWETRTLPPQSTALFSYQAELSSEFPTGAIVSSFVPTCDEEEGSICALEFATCVSEWVGECAGEDNPLDCMEFRRAICIGQFNACSDIACTGTFPPQEARRPVDPNEIVVTPSGSIRGDESLLYTIHYENTGNADAQTIDISTTLDEGLDLSSLSVMNGDSTLMLISEGGPVILLEENRQRVETVAVGDMEFEVVTPHITRWTAELRGRSLMWKLQNEFLPPGETDHISFTATPKKDLRPGAEIRASAKITFDGFETITTNEVVSVIGTTFKRGEANGDGAFNVSDGVFILLWLFAGGTQAACLDAADTDDNGAVNLIDAVRIFNFLFSGEEAPPAPGHNTCGIDTTPDVLECDPSEICS